MVHVELADGGRTREELRGLAREGNGRAGRRGREGVEGRPSMFVDDDGHHHVRYRDPPNAGAATKEEGPRRPLRVDAADANEIGCERADLRRGLHDQPLHSGPREPFDPRGTVVDLDAGRCARERLEPALEPRPIEGMQEDDHGNRDQRDQSTQTRRQAHRPPPPATARRWLIARAGAARGTKKGGDGAFLPTDFLGFLKLRHARTVGDRIRVSRPPPCPLIRAKNVVWWWELDTSMATSPVSQGESPWPIRLPTSN